MVAPVLNPHRFYERTLARAIAERGAYAYRPDVEGHLETLASRLPPGGRYYAASLCNLNFLIPDRYCIGLQELYDPSWFPRSMEAFRPSLAALTRAEAGDSALRAALGRMRDGGYTPVTLDSGSLSVYFALRPAAEPGVPAPPGGILRDAPRPAAGAVP